MQIKINNLEFIFNPKTPQALKALNGIDVEINQGEYIGIIGQTGSGKTTFIEHLNALLVPTQGQIEWIFKNQKIVDRKTKKTEEFTDSLLLLPNRRKKVKRAKDIRKRVGVVFQFAEYQLFEETIEKDIAFGPRSFGISKEEANKRAKKYLNLVGLDETYLSRSPFGLSGGQKRRVALAGILAMEPEIIVADEPTAGLDPVGVREILEIFNNLNKAGKTIIIVTHDLDNILEVAKRVLVFKDGKIVRDGETYEILKDVEFLEKNNMEPPKLLNFIFKLEQRGLKIPRCTSMKQLADYFNSLNQGGK